MEQHEKDVQECFGADDPLACMTKVVSQYKNSNVACKPRFVLLTQDNCKPCEKVQKELSRDIANGTIEQVSYDSPEGMKIMKLNDVRSVPFLILLDCKGKVILPV